MGDVIDPVALLNKPHFRCASYLFLPTVSALERLKKRRRTVLQNTAEQQQSSGEQQQQSSGEQQQQLVQAARDSRQKPLSPDGLAAAAADQLDQPRLPTGIPL